MTGGAPALAAATAGLGTEALLALACAVAAVAAGALWLRSGRALQRCRRRVEAILRSSPNGIVSADQEGRIVEFNPAAERMFGFERREVLGRPLHETILPSVLRQPRAAGFGPYVGVRDSIVGSSAEISGRRKDGSEFPLELAIAPNETGATGSSTAYLRDLTESRGAEERFRASEASYRTLVERLPAITYIADFGSGDSGPCQYVSPQIETILGYTQQEWMEDPMLWTKRLHPDDRTRVKEDEARSRAAKEPFVSEYRLLDRRGKAVWIRDEAVAVDAESGNNPHFHGVMFNVTERKQLEAQLQQAQRMEAVGRLADGVAHDFNNLLSVIINYAQFVADDLPEADGRRADIEEIRDASQRGASLVRQLLTFSRKGPVTEEVIDVNAVVRGAQRLLGRVIGEDVEVVLDLAEEPGAINLDPGQLEQVLVNLVVNAREAMPDGGRLVLQTRRAQEIPREHQREGLCPAGYVCLCVSDTGFGMDEEVKSHVFEPFFTTKRGLGGSGLGLATVYGIVQRAGGHIAIDSEVGEGTTFRIYLPASLEPAPPPVTDPPGAADDADGQTILVAEDEAPVRRVVTRILSEHGYKVLPATSGIEALGLSSAHSGEVDLLLTDVVMPHMSGRELAERLAAVGPRLKTIYMSGYTDRIIAQKGAPAEDEGFIKKPFTSEELVRKVREALSR